MRVHHTSHPLPAFPVYSCSFVAPDELVLGGGGGQSRSGVKNKLRLYKVESFKRLDPLDEYELDKGEDVPMSMAAWPKTKEIVCGINSSEDSLKSGVNQNCRQFAVQENKLAFMASTSTLTLDKAQEDNYQKVTVLSPDGNFLAVAGFKELSLLHYPSLEPAASSIHVDKEIYDASFSPTGLTVCTTASLLVYSLPPSKTGGISKKVVGKKKAVPTPSLTLLRTVDRPNLPGKNAGSTFRAARYHPQDPDVLYTMVNSLPPKTRTKNAPQISFVCKWDTKTWNVTKLRKVSDRNLTCFDISPNGKFLAYGSSDLTVGILNTQALAPLLTILKAHEFPPTTLRFSPSSDLLVSGSVDNTIRIVSVPENLVAASWSSWIIVLVTLLVILFAILAQQMH
ncbi:hypothetical protein PHLGIDRAFT_103212 [Phlebiopsis gigantea 11061_1 CR5-6]|uniref:Uncharacterized protein n=1 Tax=Phlebiopsis gigantea (strain 11061_1 CR5-6) TaxID=745531 RepID=A0A0C3SAH2_PHLG1|nr:hypothetical protein PHLGIDRAFT_103212 [Phlebiopsis gigantea 11061_1 CR5-6]